MPKKEEAVHYLKTVLEQVNPVKLIPTLILLNDKEGIITVSGQTFEWDSNIPVYVIGCGKASASMAAALENVLGNHIHSGIVISTPNPLHSPKQIKVLTGSHPYPDQTSLDSTNRLLHFIETIPSDAIVFNLLSGGSSSLLCKPAGDITIDELTTVYKSLVNSGASIGQINTVRKSISSVKGGRLLSYLKHTRLVDIIISDVPDDNPKDIGSGPTTPQLISARLAKQILEDYDLWDSLPGSVKNHINGVLKVELINGPTSITDNENHHSFIISSAKKVAQKAAEIFDSHGYSTVLESEPWSGSIEEFENYICDKLTDAIHQLKKPIAQIFYGECTVTITGNGKGGRNQELALRMANRLSERDDNITFLSAGTDGIDGPTDAAGAVVDTATIPEAFKQGVDPDAYLNNNDSYSFFEKAGGHIKTGPTGNNVMDLQFLIVE